MYTTTNKPTPKWRVKKGFFKLCCKKSHVRTVSIDGAYTFAYQDMTAPRSAIVIIQLYLIIAPIFFCVAKKIICDVRILKVARLAIMAAADGGFGTRHYRAAVCDAVSSADAHCLHHCDIS